ncbi:sugar ABC transporter permease [Roseomonas alkaliterrae]|jgi:multiple sugar transport system permease protein|uniref:Multiple sugar transport system permease protein n=1 Tax=Neoroseomonas alkaliterrae TaxID=1452450 RepID=A0A840Y602_9PROT|nr:sugar ABC transporter permease [Neoroseomonas alkaliterrae]MBB5689314.1 multiple sugar transport system permease protein [Neoroseomonas alkaliterrae]MBR0675861.1 sugar ABC transporter permease [Neoroseomonas alkaliterrae]
MTAPRQRAEARAGAAFALPAFALILALLLAPLAALLALSVTDYRLGAMAVRLVGLDNYAALFADEVFQRSLRNTFLYVAFVLPGAVFGGLGVALLVHARRRSRAFYEVAYFLPVTATLVAMATVWQFMLHPSLGPVSALLRALGFGDVDLLNDPSLALGTLALIGLWQVIGFNMVLFLAGLSAIPRDLYEAAALDGARSGPDRFLRVTWPMLGPTTMFVTITSTITAFKVFDTVVVLTRGGPLGSTETLLYVLYLEGFQYFRTGYAAAMTVVLLAFLVLLSILQARVIDRKVHYA